MADERLIPGGGVYVEPTTSGEHIVPGGGIVVVTVEAPPVGATVGLLVSSGLVNAGLINRGLVG